MIDITNSKEKCFAEIFGTCTILKRTDCDGCKWYKPRNCDDWVRIEKNGKVYLMTPEEHEKRKERINNGKYISKKSGVYWSDEVGTTGKGRL